MLKKMATDAGIAFAKSLGSESGKMIINKKGKSGQPESNLHMAKGVVELITKKYEWADVTQNISEVSLIVKKVAPSVAKALVLVEVIPIGAASIAFPLLGASLSGWIYTTSKGLALVFESYEVADSVLSGGQVDEEIQ